MNRIEPCHLQRVRLPWSEEYLLGDGLEFDGITRLTEFILFSRLYSMFLFFFLSESVSVPLSPFGQRRGR